MEADVEGKSHDPARPAMRQSSPPGFLSRLTRLVRTTAAPFLRPILPAPRHAPRSGPERPARTEQYTSTSADATELRQPPKQAATRGPDPSALRKMTFEQTEAYQADLRIKFSRTLKSFVSMESLKDTQAAGEAVFGSTARRGAQSKYEKLSKGAALHPRKLNLQHSKDEIASMPRLPDGWPPPSPGDAASSRTTSKNAQAKGISEDATVSSKEGPTPKQDSMRDAHVRPAYRDGLEEVQPRRQLDPRSRLSTR